MEKGEIAENEQFHLFQQCFPKAFFFSMCENEYIWRKELRNVGHNKSYLNCLALKIQDGTDWSWKADLDLTKSPKQI